MAADNDPFTGTWKFLADRSTLPMPPPHEWTQLIEASAHSLSITEQIVHASGRSSAISVHARFDGKHHPVTGSPLVEQIAYQRIDVRHISATGMKSGRIALTETAEVSVDRKTLTLEFSFVSADGRSTPTLAVFERVAD